MTKPDMNDVPHAPSEGAVLLRRMVIGLLGGVGLLFVAGMIAGYVAGVLERGAPDLRDAAILAAMLLAAALICYGMWRWWPRDPVAELSPRVRSARRILIGTAALAVPLGMLLGFSDGGAENALSDGPVSGGFALIALATWSAVFVMTWLWWRKIDEHEAAAYRDSANLAAHAYLFIAPSWWMATRAGWLPPQEPMPMVLAVCTLWMIVWFARRYF